MMTHHLTLFLQYIWAAPPWLTMMTMHHQWSDAHGLELNYVLKQNPISLIWWSKRTTFPISPLSSNPTNFITATCRPLRHLRSGHTSLAQTQAVSPAPSLTKIQATHSSIVNSSRSPNIEIFGHVALPMSLGGYFKVFASTRAPTPVSSSRNWLSWKDARIHMAVLFAIIVLRKTNCTGLGSLWVAIALTTLGTRAH